MSSRFTTRPELAGTFGMVGATHWLAAQAGMSMLELGGNAFDAAAAAGFVLQVVEPHQNGIGGEAPMVFYSAAEDEVFVLSGQGPSPMAATLGAFSDLGLDLVPGAGLLAACVPAAFGSWMLLLERFGSLRLREVLSPALSLARDGFPAAPILARLLAQIEATLRENWPSTVEIWLKDGPPRPGQRITNPFLAQTYRRLVEEGEAAGPSREAQLEGARRAFYEGFVAEAIGRFVSAPQPDPSGRHAGLLSPEDMAGWRATLEAPSSYAYKDFEVFKTGPWGQGPVMLQQLALLSGYDLCSLREGSPELVHLVTECSKLAFADREAYYGDPAATDVPLAELLSPAYNDERRRLVGEEASLELRPGRPGGRIPRLPHRDSPEPGEDDARDRRVGDPTSEPVKADHDTCHLDAADRFGNLISATPSGGWLQSSPAIPGLGFCLGTRAQMFWLEENLATTLRPGVRPRTTLSPSLAFRDGAPYMAFGTPGGDQQDQWPLRMFLYHAEFGLDLQESIDAATWHHEHFYSSFFPREFLCGELHLESALGGETLAELKRRGHRVIESPQWSLGRQTAVRRSSDGLLHAAADPRSSQAYAVGR
jgi:gamma-glutamyltranspeptidase/glutathione hydrolase